MRGIVRELDQAVCRHQGHLQEPARVALDYVLAGEAEPPAGSVAAGTCRARLNLIRGREDRDPLSGPRAPWMMVVRASQ